MLDSGALFFPAQGPGTHVMHRHAFKQSFHLYNIKINLKKKTELKGILFNTYQNITKLLKSKQQTFKKFKMSIYLSPGHASSAGHSLVTQCSYPSELLYLRSLFIQHPRKNIQKKKIMKQSESLFMCFYTENQFLLLILSSTR